jgi:hypothetical protein
MSKYENMTIGDVVASVIADLQSAVVVDAKTLGDRLAELTPEDYGTFCRDLTVWSNDEEHEGVKTPDGWGTVKRYGPDPVRKEALYALNVALIHTDGFERATRAYSENKETK